MLEHPLAATTRPRSGPHHVSEMWVSALQAIRLILRGKRGHTQDKPVNQLPVSPLAGLDLTPCLQLQGLWTSCKNLRVAGRPKWYRGGGRGAACPLQTLPFFPWELPAPWPAGLATSRWGEWGTSGFGGGVEPWKLRAESIPPNSRAIITGRRTQLLPAPNWEGQHQSAQPRGLGSAPGSWVWTNQAGWFQPAGKGPGFSSPTKATTGLWESLCC